MKRKLKLVAIYCVLLLPTALAGFHFGFSKGMERARIEEFGTYRASLSHCHDFPEARNVPLEDFLKARYYYLANNIPEDWLGSPVDYGPVNFQRLVIGKGTSPEREYQLFKQKNVRFQAAVTQP